MQVDSEAAKRGEVIALLTAIGLTFSFWLLYESRIGLHTISTYLLAAVTFYAFWRGSPFGATNQRGWLLASGIFAGLATYTYRSGIFVPIALFVFIIYSLIFHRGAWGKNWYLAPTVLLTAALVYAPLGYFLFSHPDASLARIGDLSGDVNALLSGNPFPLFNNSLGVLGMFGFRGDPEWRYNVAFRPIFDPLWGSLFYAGLVLALWRFKKTPYAFIVIWLVVLALPTVLSPNNPSQHRSVGAIGAAYIFPGLALDQIRVWLAERWGAIAQRAWGVAVGALLLVAAFYGIRDYFFTWPQNPEVRVIQRSDLAEAAHWLNDNAHAERILVSAEFANDLDRGSFNLERGSDSGVQFFTGADTFVLPAKPNAYIVNPRSGAIADIFRKKFLQDLVPVYSLTAPSGGDELGIYHVNEEVWNTWRSKLNLLPIAQAEHNELDLVSLNLLQTVQAGTKFKVNWTWTPNVPRHTDADELTWRAALVDNQGYVWSEAAGLGYTPSQWQEGDIVYSALDLDIAPDAPPGKYEVELRLTSKQGEIQFTGNSPFSVNNKLGTIEVRRGPVPKTKPDLPIRYPSKAKFGDAVQLAGSDAVGEVAVGEKWRLVLFWKAVAPISEDYRIRLVALTEAGQEITREEETLLGEKYPMSQWRPGEYVRSVHDLAMPADAPLGKAVIRVFLIDAQGKLVGRTDGVPIAGIEIKDHP